MTDSKTIKRGVVIGLIFLFIISSVTPMVLGYTTKISEEDKLIENFDSYHISEITSYSPYTTLDNISNTETVASDKINIQKQTLEPSDGPINSPWPICSHDVHHTGRSPHSTTNNVGFEKWRFGTNGWIVGGPVIDNDGIIYVGAKDLYAIYPNGTLKWEYDTPFHIMSTPAIDENDVIYIGTVWDSINGNYFYAIYPNGTLKWKFFIGEDIFSSPAISDDGTIYFGCSDENIYALYPNGTLKWKCTTGNYVLSSPAIGDDGTVYCGSHDTYLYALYPNNGTVKWKFPTGYYIRANPCIADDGTIYCVSRDSYLYALYPNNGTMIWKTNVHAGTSPTIGQDGTVYAGWKDLYAVNPTNGSVKWTFNVEGELGAATPCNSIDGTIYFGNYYGSDIVAVNPGGTEKWRISIGGDVMSAPAIGEDGTVYIGSNIERLYAFGYPGPNPIKPTISGQTSGKINTSYTYIFTSIDPDKDQVSYYIDWGDGNITDWTGFKPSGDAYTESHKWATQGTYTIKAKAKDTDGYESDWGALTVTVPRDKLTNNMLLIRLLERFPLLQKLIFITD